MKDAARSWFLRPISNMVFGAANCCALRMQTPAAIKRRTFLGSVLSLAASTAVLPATAQTTPRRSTRRAKVLWKTAVGLNGFESGERKYRKRYPLWEVLDFANREGFDGIELVGNWPQGGYPVPAEHERIAALRRLYDAYGLRPFSIQLGADGAFAPEDTARSAWLAEFTERVALAAKLGCPHVGLWPGGGLRGQSLETAISRLAASFREAVRIAGEAGIVPGFEIEPPFVFRSEDHMRRIHAESGMKFIYDPSHCDLFNGSSGRPHEILERLGVGNVAYVHLTDTDGTLRDGGTSKHLAVGDGHAQITESLRVLREGGFRGWIMVDTWEIPDPYDACRKAMRALQAASR